MNGTTTLDRRKHGAAVQGASEDRAGMLTAADRQARKSYVHGRARELLGETEKVKAALAKGEKLDRLKVIELRDSMDALHDDPDSVMLKLSGGPPGIKRPSDTYDLLLDAMRDMNLIITGWALSSRVGYSLLPSYEGA